jgi:hypothetical protein
LSNKNQLNQELIYDFLSQKKKNQERTKLKKFKRDVQLILRYFFFTHNVTFFFMFGLIVTINFYHYLFNYDFHLKRENWNEKKSKSKKMDTITNQKNAQKYLAAEHQTSAVFCFVLCSIKKIGRRSYKQSNL